MKTAIIYGEYHGIQKTALRRLSEIILESTDENPICIKASEFSDSGEYRCIYIGTKENNPYIADFSNKMLEHPEEYRILVTGGTVYIEGADDAGVLYGCIDFYDKYIVRFENTNDSEKYFVNIFDGVLPDFELCSRPSVKNRGIWTWGHVIYDYKCFIDNMTRLKMNTVIIWNDFVPVNAREMVEYAHECGIKVIWGFSWFWDTDCSAVEFEKVNDGISDIIAKYEKEYLPVGGDGIYFQSFTELDCEEIGGRVIAEAVTSLVNQAACELLKKHPDLELQFGLHARSVKTKLEHIKNVDPRVRIVWEDCGAFPFSYIPADIGSFEDTTKFAGAVSVLRGENDRFGAVLKGLTKLDWSTFEHQTGSFYLGKSSEYTMRGRISRKNRIWRYLQAYWLINADKAYDMLKLLCKNKNGDLDITALVEDGMFEKNIMYPVALFAEMLWDCEKDIKDIMASVALRSYVDFA